MNDVIQYSRIAAKLFGTPLFLLPDAAQNLGRYVANRQSGIDAPQASQFIGERATDEDGRILGYRSEGRVAVISSVGELVNRGAYINASSGVLSYEGIEEQFSRAGQDDQVECIVHDMDSPGGEAYGMVDCARSCKRLANGKPIVTVINSMAASAGYGLACIADEIVIGESAVAGSIGVVILHIDHSEMLADMGLKATFIHVGQKKVLGNGFEGLDEEARDHLQNKVEECMDGFAGLVAEFRPSLSLEAIRGLEADTFMAQQAIDVGLADRIGTVRSIVDELNSAQGGRIISHRKELLMTEKKGSPEAEKSTGIPQATHDQAVAQARSEGQSEGAATASERFVAALSAEGVKGDAARMDAAIDLLARSAEMSGTAVAEYVNANVAASQATDDVPDYDAGRSAAADLAAPSNGEEAKTGLAALVDKQVAKARG